MANYSNSVLLAAVGIMNDRFNAHELRKPIYGAHEAFLEFRDYSIPDMADIRKSENRTTTVKYLTKTSPSVANARSCTPSAAFGESGSINLSWKTYSTTVGHSYKIFDNNYYSEAQGFANDLYGAFLALHDAIETDAIAYLETNRTGVNAGSSSLGTFNSTADKFNIANANKDRYLNYVDTVMRENKYYGDIRHINNVAATALWKEQTAQGPANDSNLAYQFGRMKLLESHTITTGSDLITAYAFDPYAVTMIDWIPSINRKGIVSGQEEWTTMGDIFGFPITWAVFKKEACTDTTDYGGHTQDLKTVYEISVDISFAKAPLSVATETPIFKFGLLSS